MKANWARNLTVTLLVAWPASSGLAAACQSVRAHLLTLSKDPQQPLRAAPQLADEILIIDAGESQNREVLEQLAFVLRATWNGNELRRESQVNDELQAWDRDKRIETIEEFLKEVAQLPDGNNLDAFVKAVRMSLDSAEELIRNGYSLVTPTNSRFQVRVLDSVQTPARVALAKILGALGAETLADLPPYETVVYSDRPTAVQRLIPQADSLKGWLSQFAALAGEAVRERTSGEVEINGIVTSTVRLANSVDNGGISRIHLFLTRRADDIVCFLILYGSNGEELGAAGRAVLRIPTLRRANHIVPVAPEVIGDISLSRTSQEFDLISGLGRPTIPAGIEHFRPSVELLQRLLHPSESDPLGFGVTEVLLAIRKKAGLKVLACVQDSVLDTFRDCVKNDVVNVREFLAVLAEEHEIIVRDGWLLIRPRNPIESERSRIPRPTLEKMTQQANAAKHLSLRAWTKYHYESGVAAHRNPITRIYRWFVYCLWQRSYPVVDSFEDDDNPLPVLMYLGSLSETEYETLTNGRANFDLGSLRIDQRRWMREILGYRHLLLRRDTGSEEPDWLLTGSEAAPEVVLEGVVLRSHLSAATAVVNATMSFDVMKGLLNQPNTIPEIWRSFGAWPEMDVIGSMDGRYVVGRQEFVKITITLRSGMVRQLGIRGEFSPTTEPLAFRDLPEQVRRAFGGNG